jgi:hypothetical protein
MCGLVLTKEIAGIASEMFDIHHVGIIDGAIYGIASDQNLLPGWVAQFTYHV